MELATITMDRAQARETFLRYRHELRDRQRRERESVEQRIRVEDEALMRGYRALSQGRQLLRLTETLRAGGEDELHRPRLAVARADLPRVMVSRSTQGDTRFGDALRMRRGRGPAKTQSTVLAFPGLLPALPGDHWRPAVEALAVVPAIPPQYRPSASLANYHVLFEAHWQTPPEAADPALIRLLGGDLWVVLAVWDLTDLEAAVLGLRGGAA